MCGIAGYRRLSRDDRASPDLERMTRLLTHRGPDSEGYYREPGLGLGMRRLSILDLKTGDQPIANESGEVQVVFNGELYNFQELRARLQSRGHRFRTAGDTEVLVHGYEEWGEDLPKRLRGMFTFAIWDRGRQRLLVARDHFGIKPLYYAEVDGLLLFASEIKSLLGAPGLSRELDREALDQYLSFLYIPEPRTIFQEVRALPPGHRLICEAGQVRVTRYWRPRPEPGGFRTRAEAIDAVREVFEDSVRAMMVADVPLGLFLSSGVDSASILAMMARHSEEPVRTFSIGFGRDAHRWDELDEIRRLAAQFPTDHHEFRVEPDLVSQLPEAIRHFDQPFANPTAVILRLLSRETRRHTKVALSGTGGDELFAGYPRYLGMRLYQLYGWLPAALRRSAARWTERWLRDATDGRTAPHRIRRFFAGGALPFDACYARLLVALDDQRKQALYRPEHRERLGDFDPTAFVREHIDPAGSHGLAPTEYLLTADIATYLPFNQLTYADRMSMAESLEVRVPFVDQRLFEVASKIPLAWNLRRGTTKSLLREAMAPFLPAELLKRPKLGLNLPIALWFRGELKSWMQGLLSPESLERRGIFRPEAVARLIDEQLAGRRDHSLFLWALVVLELWQRDYLDGEIDTPAVPTGALQACSS